MGDLSRCPVCGGVPFIAREPSGPTTFDDNSVMIECEDEDHRFGTGSYASPEDARVRWEAKVARYLEKVNNGS